MAQLTAQQLQELMTGMADQAAERGATTALEQFQQAAAQQQGNVAVPRPLPNVSRIEPDLYSGQLDKPFPQWAATFERYCTAQANSGRPRAGGRGVYAMASDNNDRSVPPPAYEDGAASPHPNSAVQQPVETSTGAAPAARSGSGQRPRHLGTTTAWNSWFILAIIAFGLLTAAIGEPLKQQPRSARGGAEGFFICHRSSGGLLFEVPRHVKCEPPTTDEVTTLDVELLVPRQTPVEIPAGRCTLRRDTVCTYTSFLWGRAVISSKTEFSSVAVDACKSIRQQQDKRWHGTPLVQLSPDLWSTNKSLAAKYKWCCYELCVSVENFIMQGGTVASYDGYSTGSGLGSTAGCPWEASACQQPRSTIVWDRPSLGLRKCPYETRGHFSADRSGAHIMVDSLQTAVTLDGAADVCKIAKATTFKTHQGPLIRIVNASAPATLDRTKRHWPWNYNGGPSGPFGVNVPDEEHGGHEADLPKPRRRPAAPLVEPTTTTPKPPPQSVAGRLQYLEDAEVKMTSRGFKRIWLELCRSMQRVLANTWALLQLDATLGARQLLQRDDIAAAFTGEVLTVWPCQAVNVTRTHWDYEADGQCYDLMPVDTSLGRLYRLPGSRELTSRASPMSCHDVHPGVRRENNSWVTNKGQVAVQPIPVDMVWRTMWKPQPITAPALFEDALVLQAQSSIKQLRQTVMDTERMAIRLDRVIDYASQLSSDPDAAQRILRGIGEGAGAVLSGAGSAVEHIIAGAGKGIHETADAVGDLLKGPLQAIINLCVIALGIVLAAGLVFLGVRAIIHRRRKQRLANPQAGQPDNKENIELLEMPAGQPQPPAPVGEAILNMAGSRAPSRRRRWSPRAWLARVVAVLSTARQAPVVNANGFPVGPSRQPMILINVYGLAVPTLIDTGAYTSVMSYELYARLATAAKLAPSHAVLTDVNRRPIRIEGEVNLQLRLGETPEMATILVARDIDQHLILGADFLRRYRQTTFNWARGFITLGNTRMALQNNDSLPCSLPGTVRVDSNVTVPPHCCCNVNVIVQRPERSAYVVFEPSCDKQVDDGALLLDPGLLRLRQVDDYDAWSTLTVTNGTSAPVQLYRGQQLGTASPCDLVPPAQTIGVVNNSSAAATAEQEHLFQQQVEQIVNELPPEATARHRQAVRKLFDKHSSLFARHDYDVAHVTAVKHHIVLQDPAQPPIYRRPYRTAQSEREEVDRHIQEMTKQGIIEPSVSPWGAPALLVRKKCGATRLVQDYRLLNAATKGGDRYPLPNQEALLTSIGRAKYFSAMDVAWGFYNLEMTDDSKELTSFSTHAGHYQFRRMPMGLSGSPASFMTAMNLILGHLNYRSAAIYMDDVLVPATSIDQMIQRLDDVFTALRDAGFKLRMKKCSFFKASAKFLGHEITAEGIKASQDKVDKVQSFPEPKTMVQARSFLGAVGYCRKYIPGSSEIAHPLTELLKDGRPYRWTTQCQHAFNELKRRLTTAPVLAQPQFDKTFLLATDASGTALGAVLQQKDDDGLPHPIAYFSRKLTDTQTRYTVTERELLAVVESLRHFRSIIYGHPVEIHTDHAPLLPIIKGQRASTQCSPKLVRWALTISQYNITDVVYVPGIEHRVPDALSRMPTPESINAVVPPAGSGASITPQCQRDDPDCGAMIDFLERGKLPPDGARARAISQSSLDYGLVDGILVRTVHSRKRPLQLCTVVPRSLVPVVLRAYHDHPLGNHHGIVKTIDRLRQADYFWPTMAQDIHDYIKSCDVCQRVKHAPPIEPEMQPIAISEPNELVVMDVWGPHTTSRHGNIAALFVTDMFTRFTMGFPLASVDAETTALALVNRWILVFGIPRAFLSDNATNFHCEVLREVTTILGCKQKFGTPRSPTTQGMVERFNRSIGASIRAYANQRNGDDWDEYIAASCFAYNSSPHCSTGFTPFELQFGRKPRLPVDHLLQPALLMYKIDIDTYNVRLQRQLSAAFEQARQTLSISRERQKATNDKRAKDADFKIGDQVLLQRPAPSRRFSAKLQHLYAGPFDVTEVTGQRLKVSDPQGKSQFVQTRRARLYHPRERVEVAEAVPQPTPPLPSAAAPTPGEATPGHRYDLRPRKKRFP